MTKITKSAEVTKALHIAGSLGLLAGPKTKHCNAKVQPALFEAAARRAGTHSPGAVISAALASLATEDDVGSWLAARWGALAEVDPDVLASIDL